MFSKKYKLNTEKLVLAVFLLFYFVSRLVFLSKDEINPDAVNWHYRSEQFIVALKSGQFANTYQHYHPGVTLMWVTGVPIELYKQITNITLYDHLNFQTFHLVAKLSLVTAQIFITYLIFIQLKKIFDFNKGMLILSVLSFEPFFLGNSRLYHMDALLTLLVFLTLLLFYNYSKERKINYLVFSAIFCGFSVLTKSVAIGLIPFVILVLMFVFRKNLKEAIKPATIFTAISFVTIFALFPALWVKPAYTISDIFSESERIGVRDGHEHIFLGSQTEDPGVLFYPVVFLIKSTPLLALGTLAFVIYTFKNKKSPSEFITFLSIFYLTYILVMTFPSKKLDRYFLVLFPFLSTLAVEGWYLLKNSFNRFSNGPQKFIGFLYVMIFGSYILPYYLFFPYYFTYSSPIFLRPQFANKVLAQKTFGMGIFSVRDKILSDYSTTDEQYPEIGMVDTKPIKEIFPNSKVSDIRVNGTSDYDILILGANEEFPEKVFDSKDTFVKDGSLYIGGIEYWRFYVKKK